MEEKMDFDPLQDVSIDISDEILANAISSDIVKEIPIVKTVVALIKTGKSVEDYLLKRKIMTFLNEITNIPQDKVSIFLEQLDNERKRNEIGIKTLQIIDRFDEIKKASLAGKLFRLMVEQEIDVPTYLRLCYIINKCYYEDLSVLKVVQEHKELTALNKFVKSEILESLFITGLLSDNGIDGGDFLYTKGGTIFGLNEYSKIILSLI